MCDALLFVYDFSFFLCSLSTVDLFFFLKGGRGRGRGEREGEGEGEEKEPFQKFRLSFIT